MPKTKKTDAQRCSAFSYRYPTHVACILLVPPTGARDEDGTFFVHWETWCSLLALPYGVVGILLLYSPCTAAFSARYAWASRVNVAGEGVGAQELPRTVHRRAGLLCLRVNWVVLGGRVWCGWHFIFHTADGPGFVFSISTALLHGQGVNLISEGNAVGEGCLNTPRTPILPFLLFSFFRFSVPLFTRFTFLLFQSFFLN